MSFRKRNTPLSTASFAQSPTSTLLPGTRPSPQGGRTVTSTGTPSLDGLLGGFGGLPLGTSLLIGESGTTDNASALLRYYAAEGLVQGHVLHVVGVGREWTRMLPGLVGVADGRTRKQENEGGDSENEMREAGEQMKIAWRYERVRGQRGVCCRSPTLRLVEGVTVPRRVEVEFKFHSWAHWWTGLSTVLRTLTVTTASAASLNRAPYISTHDTSIASSAQEPSPFCHVFDLSKKLEHPPNAKIQYHSVEPSNTNTDTRIFTRTLRSLQEQLNSSPIDTVHRVVIPSLLSPLLYSPAASQPHHLLAFVHGLRSLLRQYSTRLVAIMSLHLEIYARSTGLVRWMELLCDGVFELTSFPHRHDGESLATSGAATANEERPHGMVKVHKLPLIEESGGGAGAAVARALGDDLAFVMSRRRFAIRPFSLPPTEGDSAAQKEAIGADGKATKESMEF